MTPDELDDALTALRWTGRTLAEALAIDETTVRRWRSGRREVPPAIGAWLRQLALAHARLPPPAAPTRED